MTYLTASQVREKIESLLHKPDGESGCWLWTHSLNTHGYGQFKWAGTKTHGVHRIYLEVIGRPVPDGLQVDHLCRVRHCVNPNHLEFVTLKENVLRGEGLTARNARKTHCQNGHPLEGDNLYIVKATGQRRCKECSRRLLRESRRRKRERGRTKP